MNEQTYGFTVSTKDKAIHVTQDQESGIILSPLEVDGLVAMLIKAKEELLSNQKNTAARPH